jgi:hypothetical protein
MDMTAMQTATSHSSEAQVQGFDNALQDILQTEARHMGPENLEEISSIYMKLQGINSHHAEDQKKRAWLLKAKKAEHCIQKLGYDAWSDLPDHKQNLIHARDEMAAIRALGGLDLDASGLKIPQMCAG